MPVEMLVPITVIFNCQLLKSSSVTPKYNVWSRLTWDRLDYTILYVTVVFESIASYRRAVAFVLFWNDLLRAIVGNISHIKIFLILCMCRLSIYEIKKICHFFIISHGSFQHFTYFSKKRTQVRNIKLNICNRHLTSLF